MRKVSLAIPFLATPLIRRVAWHIRRIGGQFDRRLVLTLLEGTLAFVLLIAVAVTLLEKPVTLDALFDSINWSIQTLLGNGDSSYVSSPGGRILSWVLILFGIAILGIVTGRSLRSSSISCSRRARAWVRPGTSSTSWCAAGTAPPATLSMS